MNPLENVLLDTVHLSAGALAVVVIIVLGVAVTVVALSQRTKVRA